MRLLILVFAIAGSSAGCTSVERAKNGHGTRTVHPFRGDSWPTRTIPDLAGRDDGSRGDIPVPFDKDGKGVVDVCLIDTDGDGGLDAIVPDDVVRDIESR
jgi:hypothetical protein